MRDTDTRVHFARYDDDDDDDDGEKGYDVKLWDLRISV